MADDGMLMNFSIGDAPLSTKPVFKGGRWRDRLIAKKVSQHRRQILQTEKPRIDTATGANASNGQIEADTVDGRPAKRPKIDEVRNSRPKQGTALQRQLRAQNKAKPQEVVSSLFSYNPSSTKSHAETGHEDATPVAPSNAPLLDGLDTFTSLGLSTSLATHLLAKLNLKAPTAIQKAAITQLVKEDSDAFIQAETGSGKTLAYLLPIVQRIMELSAPGTISNFAEFNRDGQIHRDSGLFAIILAPTRELCKQISTVLDSLLRCANWIVAGTVIGGEKKKSEKARLRKGLNILVATPGRLADHLNNTEVLRVSNVRWLVLDEGDRLMELGFEEEIRGIVEKLEQRNTLMKTVAMPGLPARRTTVMCSATMKMNVQRLGEISLKDAVHLKADPADHDAEGVSENKDSAFLAPAQLKQSYIVVPPKQRLITLTALLKRTFARKGSVMKAIVFVSCADSVDFHFEVFARREERNDKETAGVDGSSKAVGKGDTKDDGNSNQAESKSVTTETKDKATNANKKSKPDLPTVALIPTLTSPANPNLTLHKLHGSLPQPVRTATLAAFARSTNPSILLCTDVASRGLDLPNIDLVIEYDPPFSADDHLHRIGRTARVGRDGRAVIFLMPGGEEGYVKVLRKGYRDGVGRSLVRNEADDVLKRGFEGSDVVTKGREWEDKATEWQLEVERWVIEDKRAGELARKAYVSHVRAYATHVVAEREMFDVKVLHLGHLAKAFALRDRPGKMGVPGMRQGTEGGKSVSRIQGISRKDRSEDDGGDRKTHRADHNVPLTDGQEAAKKMRAKMKEHMAAASEFNIG
ncbi:MAG: ATP dependent RNA helicase (Dbp7) [Lasallia pustulata]|uniref:ATP-dependent RNA helicase n=1 Tax=Lasallia pustulata TaxID=136370 RepID=A0A5M8PFP8_9LECA|nr:MAG: ATP dependent RNA helicase (Dbp7) [Lasallia pustulata]